MKKAPFKLPESFLNQLSEFTNGYYLVTVNEDMNFETFFEFPSQVVEEGLINHIEIEVGDFQQMLRDTVQGAISGTLSGEADDEGEEDEELDGTED